MSQQFTQQIKIRTALLIFLKESSTPIVLYCENTQATYNEIKSAMKSPTVTLVEKDAQGPIKKLCIISNQIKGLALQDEQYT